MLSIWKGMRERETNNTAFGYLWENGVGVPLVWSLYKESPKKIF